MRVLSRRTLEDSLHERLVFLWHIAIWYRLVATGDSKATASSMCIVCAFGIDSSQDGPVDIQQHSVENGEFKERLFPVLPDLSLMFEKHILGRRENDIVCSGYDGA